MELSPKFPHATQVEDHVVRTYLSVFLFDLNGLSALMSKIINRRLKGKTASTADNIHGHLPLWSRQDMPGTAP